MAVIAKAVLVLMFQLPNGHLESWSLSIEPSPKYSAPELCKRIATDFLKEPEHTAGNRDPGYANRASFCIDFRVPGTDS
jgi:hypothetical protein